MLKISRGLLEGFNFSLSVRKSNYCIQLQAVLIELKVWFNLVQMANYSSIYPWTTCTHKVLYFRMFLKVYSGNVILKGSFCMPGPLTEFQYMVNVPAKTRYTHFCTPCPHVFLQNMCFDWVDIGMLWKTHEDSLQKGKRPYLLIPLKKILRLWYNLSNSTIENSKQC